MQHVHPHVISIFIPDSSWDNAFVVTPVSVKNRDNLTESSSNLKSQQADVTAFELGDALNVSEDTHAPSELGLDGMKNLSQFSND